MIHIILTEKELRGTTEETDTHLQERRRRNKMGFCCQFSVDYR